MLRYRLVEPFQIYAKRSQNAFNLRDEFFFSLPRTMFLERCKPGTRCDWIIHESILYTVAKQAKTAAEYPEFLKCTRKQLIFNVVLN